MVVVSLRVTWQSWYLRGSLFFPRPVASALVKVHVRPASWTTGGTKNRRQPALGGEHTRISTSLPASLVCLSGCSPPSVFKSRRGLTPTHCYSSIARVGGQGVGPKFHPSIPPPGEQAE